MAEFSLAKAGEEDVIHVANFLRPEHLREIRDTTALSPFEAVWRSVDDSLVVFAGRADARAVFLAGAGRTRRVPEVGTVWMLATLEVDKHRIAVARAARRLMGIAHRAVGTAAIEQFIPSWYRLGVRFLEWLGWETTEEDNPHKRKGLVRMVHKEIPEWD